MELKEIINAICIIITAITFFRIVKVQPKEDFKQRIISVLKKLLLLYAFLTAVAVTEDIKFFMAILAFVIANNELER